MLSIVWKNIFQYYKIITSQNEEIISLKKVLCTIKEKIYIISFQILKNKVTMMTTYIDNCAVLYSNLESLNFISYMYIFGSYFIQ